MTHEPIDFSDDSTDDPREDPHLLTPADDDLLDVLGHALRVSDPVPGNVLDGARAAFAWRTIDTELAELVFDSSQESSDGRAEAAKRQITFRAPGVEIEVTVEHHREQANAIVRKLPFYDPERKRT